MLIKWLNSKVFKASSIEPMTELRSTIGSRVYRKLVSGGDKCNAIKVETNGFVDMVIGNLSTEQVNNLLDKALGEGRLDLPRELNNNYSIVYSENDIPSSKPYTLVEENYDPFGYNQFAYQDIPSPIDYSDSTSYDDDESEYDDEEEDYDDWEEV